MNMSMAFGTQGDEVLFGVLSAPATKLQVMDFDPRHGSAKLAAPTVALQDKVAQLLV